MSENTTVPTPDTTATPAEEPTPRPYDKRQIALAAVATLTGVAAVTAFVLSRKDEDDSSSDDEYVEVDVTTND